MSKVEFVGQSSRDSTNPAANTGRLINFYREPVAAGGRTGYALRSAPGVAAFVDLERPLLRAMERVGDMAYVVCGGRLFTVTDAGVVTELATIPDDPNTTISANNGKVAIAAGGILHVWDGSVLSTPATGVLDTVTSVTYIGGYTVLTGSNAVSDRLIQWSALADAEDFPGLNFASAETTDEPIIRATKVNEMILVFKASSTEAWRVTGESGANAFELIVGSNSETGLKEFQALTHYPDGVAVVSSNGRVSAWDGSRLVPISTVAVNSAVEQSIPQRMFYYEARGHGFICVTFRDCPAWCYDTATTEWHERAEGVLVTPWSAKATVKLSGFWLVGYDNGKIGVFSPIPQEFGGFLKRRAYSQLYTGSAPFRVAMVELYGHVGHEAYPSEASLLVDDGSYLGELAYGFLGDSGPEQGAPKIGIRLSRDGETFGTERIRDMGETGAYWHRITLRSLGWFRTFGAEISLTAPIDTPIYATCELVAV